MYNVQTIAFLAFAGGQVLVSVSVSVKSTPRHKHTRLRPNNSISRARPRPLQTGLETETRSRHLTSPILCQILCCVRVYRVTSSVLLLVSWVLCSFC